MLCKRIGTMNDRKVPDPPVNGKNRPTLGLDQHQGKQATYETDRQTRFKSNIIDENEFSDSCQSQSDSQSNSKQAPP
jgi:hypothetical protein